MTDGTNVPAGWYRDPLGSPQLRWWDAIAWTEHVSQLDSTPTPPNTTQRGNEPEFIAATQPHEPGVLIVHPTNRELATDHTAAPTSSAPAVATAALSDMTAVVDDYSPINATVAPITSEPSRSGFSNVTLALETWNALNRAITDAVHSASEPLVELRFIDAPTLVIDPRDCVYWWASSLENLATTSADSDVETVARPLGIHHNEAGRDWEPLVWLIGTHAQPDSFDPLCLSGARFKLRRWPNLTTLNHTTEQMTMTAMLGAAYLTVTELSSLAHVEINDARRLISTFELMGLLTHTVDTIAEAVRQPIAAKPAKDGIFSRLKARFSL